MDTNPILAVANNQQMSIVAIVWEIFARAVLNKIDFEQNLPAILTQCFQVLGTSQGAIYLKDSKGKLQLKAQVECDPVFLEQAEAFLSEAGALKPFPYQGQPLSLSNLDILLVPVLCQQPTEGLLLIVIPTSTLNSNNLNILSQTLGHQLGQAIAAGETISQISMSEKRYRSLVENANDGLYIISLDGICLEANERALQIHRMSRNELIGHGFGTLIDPSQREMAGELYKKLQAHGSLSIEDLRLKTGDGSFTEVNISAAIVDLGKEKVIFAVVHDVTEHNLLEKQLRQAQKMEAIGQLTGGIAHDFNNILSVIGLYAESISRATDLTRIKTASDRILQAQQKASSLTHQLLAFSRKQIIEPKVLQLNSILKSMKEMLSRLIGENIALSFVCDPNLDDILADRGTIEQVLMNLIVNARDAMPNGGTIVVKTKNVELSEREIHKLEMGVPPGHYVLLSIEDSGIGMSPETKKKIFEPFFTTKGVGKGTGLGLATVHGIVHQAKGFISVTSEEGAGATFSIYLPRNREPILTETQNRPRLLSLDGTETILLAEDESMLREIISSSLRSRGYTVLEAKDGLEALTIMRKNQERVSLLITDVIMPELSGSQLLKSIHEFNKNVKVLFLSGYTEDILVQNEIDSKTTHFMEKPFSIDCLLQRTREILDVEGNQGE